MKTRVLNSIYSAAGGVALIGLAAGCGQKTAPAPNITVNCPTCAATQAAANASDLPVVVNGPEMTQSVPPPPQVAASANTIEVVHKLPPIPPHATPRHKRLHLVKYEDKYWLQDVDHHCYIAARDGSGHFYPACYDESGAGTVYPLYYDSDRDDYYRACSDHDNHHFRCYEDEPDYVYYYDDDPVYTDQGNGWNSACEPIVDAPAYNAGWGASIPVFSASLFLFPPWQSQWWIGGGWSAGGNSFVDVSIGRPYFDYYSVPSGYPFVYANTLYASNSGWRTNPGWYTHAQFDPAAYQSGAYRSFSGYGRPAAAGTLAASYEGTRVFHSGNNPVGGARSAPGSFAHAGGAPGSFAQAGGAPSGAARNNTASPAGASSHMASVTARPTSGSFGARTPVASEHNRPAEPTPAAANRVEARNNVTNRNQSPTAVHARPAAHTNAANVVARPTVRTPAESNHTALAPRAETHARQAPPAPARPTVRTPVEQNHTAPAPRAETHARQAPPAPARPTVRTPVEQNHTAPAPRAETHARQAPPAPARPTVRTPTESNHAAAAPRAESHARQAPPAQAQSSGRNQGSPSRQQSAPRAQPSNRGGGGGQHSTGGAQHGGGDDKHKAP